MSQDTNGQNSNLKKFRINQWIVMGSILALVFCIYSLVTGKSSNHQKIDANPNPSIVTSPEPVSETVAVPLSEPAQIETPPEVVTEITPLKKAKSIKIDRHPSSEASKTISESPKPFSGAIVELTPFYRMSSIKVSDSISGPVSTISSKLYVGGNINYIRRWSSSFDAMVGLTLANVSFAIPTGSSKSLSNSNQFISGINLGGRFQVSPKLVLELNGQAQSEVFVRPVSSSEIAIDTQYVPALGASFAFDLIKSSDHAFGISGTGKWYFQTQVGPYTVDPGSGYGGKLYYRQYGEADYQIELSYFERRQNTSGVIQTESNLGLSLKFFLPIGKPMAERD